MFPNGLFGVDAFRLLMPPVAIFCILFSVFYLRNDVARVSRLVFLQLAIVVIALLGAKFFSLLLRDWQLYEPLSSELRGGWRYPGALISVLVLGPLVKRLLAPSLPLGRYMDALAITVSGAYAVMRTSCFMSGCCVGKICTEFYCLSYQPGSQVWYQHYQQGLLEQASHPSHPVLPLHFLFMLASLLVTVFLLWFDRRRRFDGQTALLFLVLHEGAKALLESFRVPYAPQLQLVSGVACVAGLVALIVINRRSRAAMG